MVFNNCLSESAFKGSFYLGVTLAMGIGMTVIVNKVAAADKVVSEEEFSALFEPDPAPVDKDAIKTRGLAKVPRPSFESKKREATTHVLFETGSVLLKSPDSFQQL